MVAEKFQIHSTKITRRYICVSKIKSVHFCLCPQEKLPPGRRKLSISSEQWFIKNYFSPSRKGGELWS